VSPGDPQPGPISTVGSGCAALAAGAGNQSSRIFAPSNEVRVRSLATPGTFVTATGPPVFGGLHGPGPAAVVGAGAVEDDAAGVDFDADDEHAAPPRATSRATPVRPSLRPTLVPPIGDD
jgi:hypothetical protein